MAAEQQGIVHRDLKPGNLMVLPDDRVKVMDFGIAKDLWSASSTSSLAFTPRYASPEQMLGQKGIEIDIRSDLYSLGVVLYEMLAGHTPFSQETPVGLYQEKVQANFLPLPQVRPDLPPWVYQSVTRLLAAKREERYSHPQELLADLQMMPANRPVQEDRTVQEHGKTAPSPPLRIVLPSAGPSSLGVSPWPMFRHDPQHTGRSPFNGPVNPKLRWKYETGDTVFSSPAIAPDGTVYFGSDDHSLYALSASGQLRWMYETGGMVDSSPAISLDGTVYVGSEDFFLYALSPSGLLRWKYKTGGMVWSSPSIAPDGTVYVGSNDHSLYALSPSGLLCWKYETGDMVRSSPAIALNGTVYIGSWDGSLYALSPSGRLRWKSKTRNVVDSSPAIAADGSIYIGSDDHSLYALSPSGQLRWNFPTGEGVWSSPAIAPDGTVYFGSDDHTLYALSPSGQLRWKFPTGSEVWSSPAIASDGRVYVGSDGGFLYAL